METRYELLHESFSTADAEYPQFVFEHGRLRVAFRDWREALIDVLFHDVVAFSWDDGDGALDASHRDDCGYVVLGSSWLATHRKAGTVMPSEDKQHFKLCFNSVGVLQVLASRLEVLGEAVAPSDGGGS